MDKYTVKGLGKFYDRNSEAVKSGASLSASDSAITKAAGHALDLIEATKHVTLDLSFDTYANMGYALVAVAIADKSGNMNNEEIKVDLIKKAASYELFTLCNFINETPDMKCSLIINPLLSQNLLIKAEYIPDKSTKTFDVFKAYEKTYDQCFVFTNKANMPIGVNLDFVHKIISDDFLSKI